MIWPRIHDITTDTAEPPAFEALLARRTGRWISPSEYDGPKAAAEQRRAYPDIQPLTLAVPVTRAFEAAVATARDMGWEIVGANRDTSRIEAIATTPLMRFKDDVVVRMREEGGGVRVDVRSKSRLGTGDLGTNARRIRRFLDALRRAVS